MAKTEIVVKFRIDATEAIAQLKALAASLEAAFPTPEIVHMCPLGDEGLTPCCGMTPFELPRWESRMTLDPKLVTCGGGYKLAPATSEEPPKP